MERMKHTLCASILVLAAHGAQAAAIPTPCPEGQTASTVFFDGLEQGSGNFRLITPHGSNVWSASSFGPNTGTQALRALPTIEQPTESYIGIAQPIPILTDGYYLQFAHSFDFESGPGCGPPGPNGGDGGIIVYSTGGFDPFVDAAGLIVSGSQKYNGCVTSDNPLAPVIGGLRSVFGGNSGGYKVTRLNLSQFVGLNFDFAFGFGSDSLVNSPGWLVDDIQVYRCGTEPPPAPPDPNPTPPPPSPPPPASPTCRGFSATLVGTDDDDTLTGTAGPDVIVGFAGNDVIEGRGGNDLICAGPGNDKLKGGAGKDKIYGEAGKDKITGGSGFDDCNGGSGRDSAACEIVTKVP